MPGFVAYADITEVMLEKDLQRFGITPSDTTRLDRASALAKNEIMGVIERRYDPPATLPTSGGSRAAFLMVTRYRIYAQEPESLIVTTPGGGLGKHPVAKDYDAAMAQAQSVLNYTSEWPELTESVGYEEGAWGSDKRVYDAWDGQQKQGDDAAADNDELFNQQLSPDRIGD